MTRILRTSRTAALWIWAGLSFGLLVLVQFLVPDGVMLDGDKRMEWVNAALVAVGLILVRFEISDAEGALNGFGNVV